MELLLNALWLALVTAALVALFRKHRYPPDSTSIVLSLGALLCASALLFPSISITDDLHLDAFVIEDSNSTKRIANVLSHRVAPANPLPWFGILVLIGLFLVSPLLTSARARGCVVAARIWRYKTPIVSPPLLGRAPPLFCC
ncbi:MAG: hypothetical protein JO159_00225 [Acidobacteria bacterium]|nr:hypothetical protein [Acidobacteriota bacterium]MBV9624041.1 hypothetical protein [Acidobacteriota bacterium]